MLLNLASRLAPKAAPRVSLQVARAVSDVAPSTQALALGGPVAGKPRVGSRMWYNLPPGSPEALESQ